MPAESDRLRRRVRPRDRWFVGLVATAVLAGTPAAVVLAAHGPTRPAGCVTILRAGFMGGQTGTYCGRRAARLCRSEGGSERALAAECREERLAVGRKAPWP